MELFEINNQTIEETIEKARSAERKRMNHNYHELSDRVQVMLNAFEPESYVRPHRHITPPKVEYFLLIKGRGGAFTFTDDGEIEEARLIEGGSGVWGVKFSPGSWHTMIALTGGTVYFEVKDGPYELPLDKDFAPWAPEPEDKEAAADYLGMLKRHLEKL